MSRSEIVFVNQSAGYLMVDIINEYALQYKACTLMTGSLNLRNNALAEKVSVEKILTYDRRNTWRRLFTWTWGTVQVLFRLVFRHRQADLFIVSNPPFAPLLPLFLRRKFSLLIYDVYPDALIEYQLLKARSWPVKIWKWANKKVFARAERIFTITESMKTRLVEYTADPAKLKVVPVWTDNRFFSPVSKQENPFVRKLGLEHHFIILYSGNIGYTHEVEVMVELAALTKRPELFFLIIGEGDKQKLIQERIEAYQLKNCRWLPWQPTEILPFSLSAADLAVVTLGREASKLSIPSKTFNFMSVGAPVMSIAAPYSELSQLVIRHEIGANFSPDALQEMLRFIERLLDDQVFHDRLKANACKASGFYGPDNARLFAEHTSISPLV